MTHKRVLGVDWQMVTLQLRRHYKPLATVANEVGADWRHLNRLARGETLEPRYTVGVRLLDLYEDKVASTSKGVNHAEL